MVALKLGEVVTHGGSAVLEGGTENEFKRAVLACSKSSCASPGAQKWAPGPCVHTIFVRSGQSTALFSELR